MPPTLSKIEEAGRDRQPGPEESLTQAQRDLLLVGWPRTVGMTAVIVTEDELDGPVLYVVADSPGAATARITASGRIARAQGLPDGPRFRIEGRGLSGPPRGLVHSEPEP